MTRAMLLCGAIGVLCASCGSNDESGRFCIAGNEQPCSCDGGWEGYQVCAEDELSWGVCEGCAPEDSPCVPNPCTSKPPSCQETMAVAYVQEGICSLVGGQPQCTYTQASIEDCAEKGKLCQSGVCIDSGQISYSFSEHASYVTSFSIAYPDESSPCCFDFNGDDEIDNAYGEIAAAFESLFGAGGLNELYALTYSSNETKVLLEYAGLDSPVDDSELTLSRFDARDFDGDPSNNDQGMGQFSIDPSGFDVSSTPVNTFATASITAGKLTASGGTFRLLLPMLLFDVVPVTLRQAQLVADVETGPNGKGLALSDARVGGLLSLETFITAINLGIQNKCACLGLTEGLIRYNTNTPDVRPSCSPATSSQCDDLNEEEVFCDLMNEYCNAFMVYFKGDIDTDDDGHPDAISVLVNVDATSAEISGLQGPNR